MSDVKKEIGKKRKKGETQRIPPQKNPQKNKKKNE